MARVPSKAKMNNRFFWPLIDDVIWYPWADIKSLIPEPKQVTNRHVAIDQKVWDALCSNDI